MKNVWRVYIAPFNDLGVYTSYVDVTKYVDLSSMGSISTDLDNTDLDIGVFRNSSFKITLKNNKGLFSDVGESKSIFKYRRSGAKVKVTWEIEEDGPICGYAICGQAYLSEEKTIFEGLLSDDGLAMDLSQEKLSFTCIGFESLFQSEVVPFGSISNGDLFSEVLYALLNQTAITNVLTVSALNIVPGNDLTIDSIASLQNKTVQEGVNNILSASNSVLYIENSTVYVSSRTPGASVAYNFYGQSSPNGIENIQNLKDIKSGFSKIFNYITWADVASVQTDGDSVSRYNKRVKEFNFEFITDSTKRQSILAAVLAEFKDPKQEISLFTPMNYQLLDVGLLDRISIDYPLVPIPGEFPFPICGVAVCGEAVTPTMLFSFSISADDHYKVIGKSYDAKSSLIKYRLRAI